MKIENQVTNLKLSKRIDELGVKKDSVWWWRYETLQLKKDIEDKDGFPRGRSIPAYTSDELGELLPAVFNEKHYLYCEKLNDGWLINYKSEEDDGTYIWSPRNEKLEITDKKLSDAMAKMLTYLLENNLITL